MDRWTNRQTDGQSESQRRVHATRNYRGHLIHLASVYKKAADPNVISFKAKNPFLLFLLNVWLVYGSEAVCVRVYIDRLLSSHHLAKQSEGYNGLYSHIKCSGTIE